MRNLTLRPRAALISVLMLHRDCDCDGRNTALYGHVDGCPQARWWHRGLGPLRRPAAPSAADLVAAGALAYEAGSYLLERHDHDLLAEPLQVDAWAGPILIWLRDADTAVELAARCAAVRQHLKNLQDYYFGTERQQFTTQEFIVAAACYAAGIGDRPVAPELGRAAMATAGGTLPRRSR